jgi:hypothetical protein
MNESTKLGRPQDPNAITRVGVNLLIWMEKGDMVKLRSISKKEKVSMAEVIRRLIREW